jgi:hypothetical protein
MEILEAIPDRESQSKGSNSSGSATLTSNKDLDLAILDPAVEEKRVMKSSTPMKSAMKKVLNLDKPLPPKPRVPIGSKNPLPPPPTITKSPASVKSAKLPSLPKSFDAKPNLLKLFGKPPSLPKKPRSRLPLHPSVVSLHSQLSSMNRSMDSLSVARVSVDLLRRKDSKMTLISVAEGLELPFDMWLRALPYIEGRVGTPRN